MRDGGRCLIFPDAWQDDLQDPAESRASPRFPQTRTAVADVADGVKFSTTGPLLRARSAVLYPVASLDHADRLGYSSTQSAEAVSIIQAVSYLSRKLCKLDTGPQVASGSKGSCR